MIFRNPHIVANCNEIRIQIYRREIRIIVPMYHDPIYAMPSYFQKIINVPTGSPLWQSTIPVVGHNLVIFILLTYRLDRLGLKSKLNPD